MTKKLLRLLRIAPLAILFAGVASAQTTGTIIGVVTDASTGKPVAGAVVIATSPNMQGEQTAVTDGNGNYRLTLLPAGEYKLAVQLEGYKPSDRSDIRLSIDKTLRANLAVVPEAVTIDEQVVRTGAAPVVNVGSVESGSVISSEFVASIPVGRGFDAIAQVSPTASADTYGTGFSGAQSPENTYILDGLSVSDPVFGTNNANMLSNFVQEIDVKTGNFSAEYGRATGGIMNVVTKSGSNEFHGSVFGNYTPSFLVQSDGNVVGSNGQAIAYQTKASEGNYDLDFGFEVGGPIMKDKLWFFAGFAPVKTERNFERFLRRNELNATNTARVVDPETGFFKWNKIEGTEEVTSIGSTRYQFAGKLTYMVDENHQLGLSTYGTPGSTQAYSAVGAPTRRTFDNDNGSLNLLGRYGGKFLDKRLVVEALAGFHRTTDKDQPTDFQKNTPMTQWAYFTNGRVPLTSLAPFEAALGSAAVTDACDPATDPNGIACYVNGYNTGGYDFTGDYTADRLQGRLSASYLVEAFGSHNFKGGLDLERNTYDIKKFYSGGQRYVNYADIDYVYAARGYGRVLGPALPGTPEFGDGNLYPSAAGEEVEWIPVEGSQSVTNSFAYYLQDSWSIPDTGLTLNAGIRLETQSMEATNTGIKGIDVNNMWSPRLQAIWDFTGTGRSKVGASWGRFYYAIPLDMADRAFGNEEAATAAWECDDHTPGAMPTDPAEDAACSVLIGDAGSGPSGSPYGDDAYTYVNVGSITPIQPDVEGIYVDQFGAQIEYELFSDLSVGFDYQGRRQGTVIEDMSDNDGTTYFIGNPGVGGQFTATYFPESPNSWTETKNPKEVVAFDNFTRRDVVVAFPKPVRSYDGFTFKMTKNFSQNWLAQASYTYAYLRGNYAGVFRPEDGQLDPGITAEYDLATLMANRTGYLPGDVPHTFKLYGAYNFKLSPKLNITASTAFTTNSGTPVNALGRHPIYGAGQAWVTQRGSVGRTDWLTKLDLGARIEYTITPPYAVRFTVDVFNVLNTQDTLSLDQNYTADTVQPIAGVTCNSDAASSAVAYDKLRSDCPDVAYLKTTDGRPVLVNRNFGKPAVTTTAFQAPLSLRLGLALTF